MCWRKIDDCGFFITMAHSSMPTDNGWRVSALIKIKGVIHFCLFRFRSLTLSLSHTHFFRFQLINPNPRMGLHMKLGSPTKRGANPIKYHSRPRHAWLTHEMVLSLFISTWHYFPFAFIFFLFALLCANSSEHGQKVGYGQWKFVSFFLWWSFHKN